MCLSPSRHLPTTKCAHTKQDSRVIKQEATPGKVQGYTENWELSQRQGDRNLNSGPIGEESPYQQLMS